MKKITLALFCALTIFGQFSYSQHKLRVAAYNLLNYSDYSNDARNQSFQTVINTMKPDVLAVEEIKSLSAVNQFLTNVMGSKYKAGTFIDGPDTDNALFYSDSLFNFISNQRIPTPLRDINQFTLSHKFTGDTLIIFVVHLKASEGSTNEQERLAEATILRNVTSILPATIDFLVMGDFNFYSSSEPAYQKLINQSTPGYFIDPSSLVGSWNNNSAYAKVHSQSTHTTATGDFTGGGLDDRFDMILMSSALMSPGKIDYADSSYAPFGNDGYHFNRAINEQPFLIISGTVANALFNSSDHLPVYADFYFGVAVSVDNEKISISDYKLFQNYPNPFNPSTTIEFSVPRTQQIKLAVYDLLGREVKVVFSGIAHGGINKFILSMNNFCSGTYFYRLVSGDVTITKKFTLLK